mgnify:CR=1 FL=1
MVDVASAATPATADPIGNNEPTHRQRDGFFGILGKYGLFFLAIILLVVFSVAQPDIFATLDNYRSILDNQTIVVLLAFAAMVPLIVGRFDLSVAPVLSISHVLAVGLIVKQGWSPAAAIAATLGHPAGRGWAHHGGQRQRAQLLPHAGSNPLPGWLTLRNRQHPARC